MRRFAWLVLVIAGSTAGAQEVMDQTGRHMGLTERKGDPFVFCKSGMKNGVAWFTVPPYIMPMITPGYCVIPSTSCPYQYSISWSQDEVDAWYEYLKVCPTRESTDYGRWDGENGSATSSPIDH